MSSNKSRIRFIAPILAGGLLVAVVSFVVAYSLRSDSSASLANTSESASSSSTLGSKENPHTVALTKDQTKPVDLLINVGDYVQFNSKDGSEHQIIEGKPTEDHGHDAYADAVHGHEHGESRSMLDSGVFAADEGYLVQFSNVGKYNFHDNYNHDYAITVIVYDKSKKLEDIKIE